MEGGPRDIRGTSGKELPTTWQHGYSLAHILVLAGAFILIGMDSSTLAKSDAINKGQPS